jgi:hypothetical protein
VTYRTETSVDPRISPALFLRADSLGEATQSASPEPAESSATQNGRARPNLDAPPLDATILDALVGYAESRLADAERAPTTPRYDGPATAAYRHLRERGFTHDEVRELRFGLFTTPQDVHDWLRRMGFSEGAIRESGLVFDADGRPRHDWTGNVVVPIVDRGRSTKGSETIDLFVFDPANPGDACFLRGPAATDVAAYGLHEAAFGCAVGERLVLVENVVDAMYLRRRGLPNVAATGCPPARFTPQRWRNLVREGVTSVTLAFERDAGRASRIHDVLAHALTARVAPEVFVVDAAVYRDTNSAAAFVQRYGCDPARTAFRTAAHAFNAKDYEPGVDAPRPRPEPRPKPAFRPTVEPRDLVNGTATSERYRTFLASEIEKIAHPAERSAWQAFLADVAGAMRLGEFDRARRIADGWYARLRPVAPPAAEPLPATPVAETGGGTSLTEAIASIRRETNRDLGHLDGFCPDAFEAGESVETIEVATRTARLATLCGRLARAIEGQPEGCHVVIRGEFATREIVLGLIARMVFGMTDGPGFDLEEVWSRLTGNDPREGYEDRPWLIDEAVDRLFQSAVRVRFADGCEGGDDRDSAEALFAVIERERGTRPVRSILCGGSLLADDARSLASRFECPVTLVREPAEAASRPATTYVRSSEPQPSEARTAEPSSSAYRYEPEWSNWHPMEQGPTFAARPSQPGFHGVLRDWIDFEEQRRVRPR